MKTGFCELPVASMIKADWNYKVDDAKLSAKLEENIRRNGQIENIIVRELDDGTFEVVNGNHRLDVMRRLEFENVYCYNLGSVGLPEAQRIAIETNETKFKSEAVMRGLQADFTIDDLTMTISVGDLNVSPAFQKDILLDDSITDNDNIYTHKIKSPIYEPKTVKPAVSMLFSRERENQLLRQIDEADIDDDVKSFLRLAASRHTVFHYDKIAEYYAHSDADVQRLMEESALVIIDFDRAIENGYVMLVDKVEKLYEDELKGDEDDEA